MMYTGSQDASRRPDHASLGLTSRTAGFARHFTSALRALPLSLGIALVSAAGSGALASGCGNWENDETVEFWRTASVETVTTCLTDVDFSEPGRGDASKPLIMAARYSNDPAVVRTLIRAGARMGPDDPEGGNYTIALHEAAKHNKNPAIVDVLLEHGMRFLDSYNEEYGTPLSYAARNKSVDVATTLLTAGADVDKGSYARWFTPLHVAARRDDNADMIALLAGADVNGGDCNGETPLHHAVEFTMTMTTTTATLQALLDAGADVNARNARDRRDPCSASDGSPLGATPLHFAAQHNGNAAVIEALTAGGADTTVIGGDRPLTPLHYAAAYNPSPAVTRALADAGADVNARVSLTGLSDGETIRLHGYLGDTTRIVNDMTPLHLAAMATSEAGVVSALVASGADVEARDAKDLTPLYYAVTANDKPDVAAALVREGADVNAMSTDYPAATLLHRLARYGEDPSIIAKFVAAGADVNAKDGAEARPLHYAATFNKNPDIVVALVAAGADVNARMRSRYDLEKGRDIGETPLHRAVRYNSEPAVTRALIDAGADTRAPDEHGDTPLDLTRHSSDEVRDMLDASTWQDSRKDPSVLPAGTLVVIPRWVHERFEKNKDLGDAFNYLVVEFSIPDRSILNEGQTTSYLPLTRRDDPNEETIMVDIMNMRSFDIGNKNIFVTRSETKALGVPDKIRDSMRNGPPNESPNQP